MFFSMYKNLVVGDIEHAWYLKCGRCSTPLYLSTINFIIPWYIWPNGPWSLSVFVGCSLSVVAYIGSWENASMPNVSRGGWTRMLGESLGMLHIIDFVSLMRRISNFLMSGLKRKAA